MNRRKYFYAQPCHMTGSQLQACDCLAPPNILSTEERILVTVLFEASELETGTFECDVFPIARPDQIQKPHTVDEIPNPVN